jgi:hypothetical protein
VIEWWPFVALLLLIGIALILGIGLIWKAARNETKHSPRFPAIKRAVDDSERQEKEKQ